MRPRANASSEAALRAFGPNYYVGNNCRFYWRGIGLTIVMANFGGGDPCASAQIGYMAGPLSRRWRTSRGLRIGHSYATLRRLYPGATRQGAYWWLVRGYFPGIGPFSVVSARVSAGRVAQFRVWIGGAGE